MPSLSHDEVAFALANRHTTLQVLIDCPHAKNELEDTLDCSRSTINRAIRELRDVSLIRYDNGVWTPTLLGKYAYNAREKYLNYVQTLTEANSLLDHLPLNRSVDSAMLEDANVIETDTSIPDMILETLIEQITGSKTIRIVTPTVVIGFARKLYDQIITKNSCDTSVIISRTASERITSTYPELTQAFTSNTNTKCYLASIPFKFGFWISDDNTGLIVFTDFGIGGLLVNDTKSSIAWAEDQYNHIRQAADPVLLPDNLNKKSRL